MDLKGKEEALKNARRHIMIASTLVYGSASGVEPFEISKCLNIMGKTLADFRLILASIIGEIEDYKDIEFEIPISPTVKIFESFRTSEGQAQ